MDQYNVYMIEDLEDKQACFLRILEYANALAKDAGLSESFEPGFSSVPKDAREAALRSADLWKALEDDRGIYLIDLDLVSADESFLDRFDTDEDAVYSEVNACYEELRKTQATKTLVSKALDDYAIAVHILLYCKLKRKPALLVSTQPSAALVSEVRRLNLATSANETFPQDPNNLEPETVDTWARLLLGLSDPLNRIKGLTSGWFAKKKGVEWRNFREDGLPHDPDGWKEIDISGHRDHVSSVFPNFPQRWWDDELKATALHECLKTAIGAHAQWMGRFHDKPLSLGGAYLFFLLALWQKHPSMKDEFLVDDWTCFCTVTPNKKVVPHSFLGYQHPECAERSVRSLYEFFLSIVDLGDGQTIGLSEFIPPRKGRPYFCLRLNWSPEDFRKIAIELQTKIEEGFKNQAGLALPQGKTVGAFLRFLVASQIRDRGFGAKGVLCIDDDTNALTKDKCLLKIGQFDALP